MILAIVSIALFAILYKNTNNQIQRFSKQLEIKGKQNYNKEKKEISGVSYSDIIKLSNKYNGKIKDFKINNRDSKVIDTVISVEGNKQKISELFQEVRSNKNLVKINSIRLDNKNQNEEKINLDVDLEFKLKG